MSFNAQVVMNFVPFMVSNFYMITPGATSKFDLLELLYCYMSS
jgi:hypothetical protein